MTPNCAVFTPVVVGIHPSPSSGLPVPEIRNESPQDRALLMLSRAFAITLSTVKPKCAINSLIGADAPKSSCPTTSPASPTYLLQPKVVPASTATLARTPGGSTSALYSGDCFSNNSHEGIETTRAFTPSAVSFS